MKKLVFFPSEPLDSYIDVGSTFEYLADYYNPGGFFDEAYCLSPWKCSRESFGKIKCIQARPRQFKKIIEQIKPDVVRAYGGYRAADWAAVSKVKGIPTIVSLHDTNPDLLFESVKYADAIISMSKSVQDAAIQKLSLQGKKMWIMPNRIDTDLFSRKEPNKKAEELTRRFGEGKHLLHVGRKAEQKNLDTVIKALTLLDDSYKAIFVGRGDVLPFQQLAEQCGVADRCYFVKSVPNNELPYWYSWCDCMCTPSRWEGFGFVFIEAAACETVIVTSNIGPMNEYLSSESAILVDDYESPEAIAKAVVMATTSETDIIQQIRKNSRLVGLRFKKENVDQLEVKIYQEVIQMDTHDSNYYSSLELCKYFWNEAISGFFQHIKIMVYSNKTAKKAYHVLLKVKQLIVPK